MANRWRALRIMSSLLFMIIALTTASICTHAQEPQCTFTLSNVSFGTVDPSKPDQFDAAGALSYACTSDPKEILRICPSLGGMENDGTRWMIDSAGNKLAYNLYTDVDRNAVWGNWESGPARGATIEIPAGRADRIKINGSKSIYGRITAEQQGVPPGVYKVIIDGTKIIVSYGYASKGACSAFKNGVKVNNSLTVSAKVTTSESELRSSGLPETIRRELSNRTENLNELSQKLPLLHRGLQESAAIFNSSDLLTSG